MPGTRGKRWLATPALIAAAGLGTITPAQATARTRTVTTVYVANVSSDSITTINAATGKAGPSIRVPGGPYLLAATPDGRTLYAATYTSIVPDQHRDRCPGTPIPGRAVAFAFSPGGSTLYALIINGLQEHRRPDRHRHRHGRHPDPGGRRRHGHGHHPGREHAVCR